MKIEVEEKSLIINGHPFQFPFTLEELMSVIGKYSFHERISYSWDDLGLECTVPDENGVSGLYIYFTPRVLLEHPSKTYTGEYFVNGEDHTRREYMDKERTGDFEILNHAVKNVISISLIQPYIPVPEIENPDLYQLKSTEGEAIIFKDINFKLAVLDVLMYSRKLIKPVFDLDEFAKRYTVRKINVFSEGKNIIPEAMAYFENIRIDKKLAPEITELFQDDISRIYYHIMPMGDKKDGRFHIQHAEDAEQFPNLKKVTLYPGEDTAIKSEFEKRGIEVSYS
ncbi:MAG TPA: hypothetical protein VK826_17095 [Bacteroidia bacterium]|nr:hypothetical protein [Bacteroidia bacterium]